MKRLPLFADADDAAHEAPALSDDLLPRMAAVLNMGRLGWQARAVGNPFFAHGITPEQAMRKALVAAKHEATPTPSKARIVLL